MQEKLKKKDLKTFYKKRTVLFKRTIHVDRKRFELL